MCHYLINIRGKYSIAIRLQLHIVEMYVNITSNDTQKLFIEY